MFGFKLIGHRGWGPTHNFDMDASYPENTLLAFDHALRNEADGIETDILLTKDLQPVILHDQRLSEHVIPSQRDYVAGRSARDFTLDELKQFDLGQGEQIPSLDEMLDLMVERYPDAIINLDVKDRSLVDPILNILNKYAGRLFEENIIISSYDWDLLRDFRNNHATLNLVPAIKTAILFGPENYDADTYLPTVPEYAKNAKESVLRIKDELDCIAFDCAITDVRPPLLEWASECGVGLQVSTSNSRVDAEHIDYEMLRALKNATSSKLSFVICKVDEPGPIRRGLENLPTRRISEFFGSPDYRL